MKIIVKLRISFENDSAPANFSKRSEFKSCLLVKHEILWFSYENFKLFEAYKKEHLENITDPANLVIHSEV